MENTAVCAHCGHQYTYPSGLAPKTGMHCPSCDKLLDVRTGQPFGQLTNAAPAEDAPPRQASKASSLPPKKQRSVESRALAPQKNGELRESRHRAKDEERKGKRDAEPLPVAAWIAWVLAFLAFVAGMIYLFDAEAVSPQNQSAIIFCCTAAILFVQGLMASRQR